MLARRVMHDLRRAIVMISFLIDACFRTSETHLYFFKVQSAVLEFSAWECRAIHDRLFKNYAPCVQKLLAERSIK
jgi:hypothetical protein